MSQHETVTTNPIYAQLLYAELSGIQGVTNIDLPSSGERIIYPNGTVFFFGIDDAQDVIAVFTAVRDAIAAHVAIPAPGPAGLTGSDLDEAWEQVGRKIAKADASLSLFRQDAGAFDAQLEAVLTGATQEVINRRIAWMLYNVQRVIGMPKPDDYDPFNEATLQVNGSGFVWSPIGPPWPGG